LRRNLWRRRRKKKKKMTDSMANRDWVDVEEGDGLLPAPLRQLTLRSCNKGRKEVSH